MNFLSEECLWAKKSLFASGLCYIPLQVLKDFCGFLEHTISEVFINRNIIWEYLASIDVLKKLLKWYL